MGIKTQLNYAVMKIITIFYKIPDCFYNAMKAQSTWYIIQKHRIPGLAGNLKGIVASDARVSCPLPANKITGANRYVQIYKRENEKVYSLQILMFC